MYAHPTEPKSIGGVLDNVFGLFRIAWWPCFALALIAAVLAVVPTIYIVATLGNDPLAPMAVLSDPGYYVVVVVITLLGMIVQMALLARIHGVATQADVSVAQALSRGARLLPRTFVATLLYALVVMPAFLALIIPGIWISVALLFYTVMIVIEDAGIVDSLKSSYRLTKGNWWRTVAIFLVVGIIAIVLFVVVGIVAGGMSAISGDFVTTTLVTQGINLLAYVFIYPLFYAAFMSIYYDLKLRTEGGDLASRVESLG